MFQQHQKKQEKSPKIRKGGLNSGWALHANIFALKAQSCHTISYDPCMVYLPICFDFLWQMQVNVSVPRILWVYYTCSLFSPIFFDKHLVCACRRKNYFTVYQPVYLLVYRTWMSQEVCERLGSVGCNPKEYPGLIGRWNNPLILTIDPNFLGHPVVHLKAKKPAVKGQTLF